MLLCVLKVLSGVDTSVVSSDVAATKDGYACVYGRRPLFCHYGNMRKATLFQMIKAAYICHCENLIKALGTEWR